MGEITTWKDVVFLDVIDVEGLTLSQALQKYAEEYGIHEDGWSDIEDLKPCHCVVCQTLTPMATKMEARLAQLEALARDSVAARDAIVNIVDTRIQELEKMESDADNLNSFSVAAHTNEARVIRNRIKALLAHPAA